MSLLSLTNITAGYGLVQVLEGVSFDLAEGEVLALMGRNGMGKSTTIKVLMQLLPASSGEVRFAGRKLTGLPAHKAAQCGLGLVPEGRRVFGPLSVAENLSVAARPGPWNLPRVTQLFPRLGERLGQQAKTLSGGEQQMLAIGRALMTNPRLLILDEATEGLAPVVRAEIWEGIRALKTEGLSILVVDKSLRELASVADRAVIVERGSVVWDGTMADLTHADATRWLGV